MLINKIKSTAKDIYNQVIENRRHLHAHPELSFAEFETSAYVKGRLNELEISWKPIAGSGVLAMIKGDKPSRQVVALRADMDALAIDEANDIEWASQNKGVMHAMWP